MNPRAARKGDVVIRVRCRCGPVLVLESVRASWRCGQCNGRGTDHLRLTLGPDGAVPYVDPLDLPDQTTATKGTAA